MNCLLCVFKVESIVLYMENTLFFAVMFDGSELYLVVYVENYLRFATQVEHVFMYHLTITWFRMQL